MGCCLSTNNGPSTSQKQQHHFQLRSESLKQTKSPPPSLYQEETVKEVLSETPKPKPSPAPPQPVIKNPPPPPQQQQQEDIIHEKERFHIDQAFLDEIKVQETKFKKQKKILQEEVHHQDRIFEQEESEVCSLSYSESVSTTTNDKKDCYDDDGDDDDEVKQRVSRSPLPSRNRLPGDLGPRKDRVICKSPTRRTEQSPSRRKSAISGGSVRLVKSRESSPGQMGTRRGFKSDPNRREPGEASGRRSRSPATNRSVMGRSPSTRKTNRSPGRVKKDPIESGTTNADGCMEAKWPRTNNNNADGTTNESLENPLVSLECFIFL